MQFFGLFFNVAFPLSLLFEICVLFLPLSVSLFFYVYRCLLYFYVPILPSFCPMYLGVYRTYVTCCLFVPCILLSFCPMYLGVFCPIYLGVYRTYVTCCLFVPCILVSFCPMYLDVYRSYVTCCLLSHVSCCLFALCIWVSFVLCLFIHQCILLSFNALMYLAVVLSFFDSHCL